MSWQMPLRSRLILRQSSVHSALSCRKPATAAQRLAAHKRFASIAPPHLRSRSWRSSAMRWGIAAAGVYFYNTSDLFAEEAPAAATPSVLENDEEKAYPSLASTLSLSSRSSQPSTSSHSLAVEPKSPQQDAQTKAQVENLTSEPASSSQELEEDAASQGAFNEETGEINWDCPCLGGMAHGPCGPEFREAFSCFVFSKEEPKGMDCIDRFRGMQDCFKRHPDVYSAELGDGDADDDEAGIPEGEARESGIIKDGDVATAGAGQLAASEVAAGAAGGPSAASAAEAISAKEYASNETTRKIVDVTPATETTALPSSSAEDHHEEQSEPPTRTVSVTATIPSQQQAAGTTDTIIEKIGQEEEELVPKAAHDATSQVSRRSTGE